MSIDPEQITDVGKSFLQSLQTAALSRGLCHQGTFRCRWCLRSYAQLFGTELCLKALIALEGGKSTGHELLKLFDKLSSQSELHLPRHFH